jgi:ATP-binding cassette subfamily B multidrug efflux pump
MKPLQSKALKKVLFYAKPYQNRFNWVIVWAFILAIFAALRPLILKEIVDDFLIVVLKLIFCL